MELFFADIRRNWFLFLVFPFLTMFKFFRLRFCQCDAGNNHTIIIIIIIIIYSLEVFTSAKADGLSQEI